MYRPRQRFVGHTSTYWRVIKTFNNNNNNTANNNNNKTLVTTELNFIRRWQQCGVYRVARKTLQHSALCLF